MELRFGAESRGGVLEVFFHSLWQSHVEDSGAVGGRDFFLGAANRGTLPRKRHRRRSVAESFADRPLGHDEAMTQTDGDAAEGPVLGNRPEGKWIVDVEFVEIAGIDPETHRPWSATVGVRRA